MSARRSRKRNDETAEAPADAGAPAPSSDDEIEILEVTGVNETEMPARDPAAQGPVLIETQDPAPSADLDAARRERDHFEELWKRQQAEFDNFRKRVERDAEQRRVGDAAALVTRLLPVLDNLEAAVAAPGADPADPLRRGLALIQKQVLDLLGKEGLGVIATVGTRFDPALHEAVEVVPGDAASDGTILAEMRKGYTFKERMIRAALVRVASGEAASGEGPAAAAAG